MASSSFNPKVVEGITRVEKLSSGAIKNPAETEETEVAEEGGVEGQSNVNAEFLLSTAINLLSGLSVQLTRVDEIAFNEEEVKVLSATWSPFISKDISPIWAAVITTLVIVGGKIMIYYKVKEGHGKPTTIEVH